MHPRVRVRVHVRVRVRARVCVVRYECRRCWATSCRSWPPAWVKQRTSGGGGGDTGDGGEIILARGIFAASSSPSTATSGPQVMASQSNNHQQHACRQPPFHAGDAKLYTQSCTESVLFAVLLCQGTRNDSTSAYTCESHSHITNVVVQRTRRYDMDGVLGCGAIQEAKILRPRGSVVGRENVGVFASPLLSLPLTRLKLWTLGY